MLYNIYIQLHLRLYYSVTVHLRIVCYIAKYLMLYITYCVSVSKDYMIAML